MSQQLEATLEQLGGTSQLLADGARLHEEATLPIVVRSHPTRQLPEQGMIGDVPVGAEGRTARGVDRGRDSVQQWRHLRKQVGEVAERVTAQLLHAKRSQHTERAT